MNSCSYLKQWENANEEQFHIPLSTAIEIWTQDGSPEFYYNYDEVETSHFSDDHMITIVCVPGILDNSKVEVPVGLLKQWKSIWEMNFDLSQEAGIPIVISKEILTIIMNYYELSCMNTSITTKEGKRLSMDQFEVEFFISLQQSQKILFEVIIEANNLNYKRLLDCLCLGVAQDLQSKTPEQIRKEYNITKEFTPEEEEKARLEFYETVSNYGGKASGKTNSNESKNKKETKNNSSQSLTSSKGEEKSDSYCSLF